MGAKYVFNPLTGNLDTTDVVAFNGEVNLGTAAAPSVFFTGDTNTGIYSPGADQVAISTNGTGRLFVDDSGNVGVGATSPDSILHISDSVSGAPAEVTLENTATTADSDVRLSFNTFASGTKKTRGYIQGSGNDSASGDLIFATRKSGTTSESMRLDGLGRLGLGTSAPNLPLTVAYSDTSAIPTNAIASPSTGSVQIFNTSDSANYSGIYLQTRTTGASAALMGLRYNTSFSDGDIFFRLRNGAGTSIEPLTIKSSGNVGIGTTSPTQKLQITDGSLSNFYIAPGYDGGTGTTIGVGGGEYLAFNGAPFTTERMRIDSSGRLLVGTSTSSGDGSTVQIVNNTANALEIFRNQSSLFGPGLILNKSRGSTASPAVVLDGDDVGTIVFRGYSGAASSYLGAARIEGQIDGTPDSGGDTTDMPGRLVFSVTADGASSPTEAMRIKNSRIINIANTPVYADNAAAKTGGLVDGDVYRTSTGDLKIVYT